MQKMPTPLALSRSFCLSICLGILPFPLVAAPGGGPAPSEDAMAFDLHSSPTAADWRYFIRAGEKDRERLWTTQAALGAKFGDWAWGWRLGWVRTCAASERPYCAEIMKSALADRALVVRAEAATRLGRRFEGTGYTAVLGLLAQSYAGSRNLRHGQPLYVQHRILFAIHRIGSKAGTDLGERLAATHPQTRTYWQKLTGAPHTARSKS